MTPTIPFASVAEADDYHSDHLFGAAWVDADVADKQAALVTASRRLLAHVGWLERAFFYYSVMPTALRDATAEFARLLIERGDPFAASDTSGMKRMKAGPVDIEFTDSAGTAEPVPPEVLAMLRPLTVYQGSRLNVPLIRF